MCPYDGLTQPTPPFQQPAGRYRVDQGPPVHKSKTCLVVFAVDIRTGALVALKMMCDREQFERELLCRFGSAVDDGPPIDTTSCVVGIQAWHTPADAPFSCSGGTGDDAIRTEEVEHTAIDAEYPYVLVMPQGQRSLWLTLGSERVAGVDRDRAVELFRFTTERVAQLHTVGLIHCDLKPRNVLRMPSKEGDGGNYLQLCDLDAALHLGAARPAELKSSTAYCPPELARGLFGGAPLADLPGAAPSFDVWSLGVILFELCTGRHLFAQDISDDELVNEEDKTRICAWLCISDEELAPVPPALGDDAKHLIRWCLQGDPAKRPSVQDILDHRLLGGPNAPPELEHTDLADRTAWYLRDGELLEANSARMRYHCFISHSQAEASGNIGTMFHMFEQLGKCVCAQRLHYEPPQQIRQLWLALADSLRLHHHRFLCWRRHTLLARHECRGPHVGGHAARRPRQRSLRALPHEQHAVAQLLPLRDQLGD